MRRAGLAALLAFALAGGAAACGDDDGASGLEASATSAASAGSGGEGGFSLGTGGATTSGGVDQACVSDVVAGEPVPVAMYIMFDKSGSMLFDQKWAGSKAALIAFFQAQSSAGLDVALRFFPDDDPVAGCNETACNASACATPLVDLGTLNALPAHSDPQQEALVSAVESKTTGGQTPMYAALAGATQFAASHASEDGRTAVVLVTDGEPNGCNEDTSAIAALASDALASSGVLTYAIGMDGANTAQLDQIAAAGGTEKAFVVSNGNVTGELAAALASIRTTQLDCTFTVPEPSQLGEELDPGQVNVSYLPGNGTNETVPQVSGESACSGDGWYYDDPVAPSTVHLCPDSCTEVQGNPDAQIQLVLGCKTIVK